jgi:hypothetical protein
VRDLSTGGAHVHALPCDRRNGDAAAMIHFSRALYIAGLALATSCTDNVSQIDQSIVVPRPPPFPPGDPPPATAFGVTQFATTDCGATGMQEVADACNGSGLGCLADVPVKICGTQEDEIFTGVSFGASTGPSPRYPGYGGRGEQIADAGLCLLKDLDGGAVETESLDLGLGANASQRVGFLSFDPTAKQMRGWRQMRFHLPFVGDVDLRPQEFTATVADWHHPYTDHAQHKIGSYIVQDGFALDLVGDTSNEVMTMNLPAIPIETPYGEFSAQPQFAVTQTAVVVDYQPTSKTRLDQLLPTATPLVDEVFGRFSGANETDALALAPFGGGPIGTGWESQMGLGSRMPKPVFIYTGTPFFDHRPDFDLDQPRQDSENKPGFFVSGGIDIVYSPTGLLPDWLTNAGVNLEFDVYFKPHLDVAIAGQLEVHAAEAAASGDSGAKSTLEELRLISGTGGHVSAAITMGADLHAWIDLGIFGTYDLVPEMHPHFDLPISSSDKIMNQFQTADAIMTDHVSLNPADAGWDFSEMITLRGTPITDKRGFIAECLATKPDDQPPPKGSWSPGGPDGFPVSFQICNFCVFNYGFDDANSNRHIPVGATTLMPSSPPASWTCTNRSTGCFDVCEWNFSTGAGEVVISQADGPAFCDRPQ